MRTPEAKSYPVRSPLQVYRNRDYQAHHLDDRHFDALNRGDADGACAVSMATTGCLDALDDLPAGSIVAGKYGARDYYDQRYTTRGFTLADQEAWEALIESVCERSQPKW